jgi:MerR family transcriptional regulator, thiopeptide resistance regulator
MDYTVSELANISGVTIRTLRFYDEIGLLRPAYVADNGYRYYGKKQLLLLQQILFFRELGFELKEIKEAITQSDFDKMHTLRLHQQTLQEKITRLNNLVNTIDTTINYLEGKQTMEEKKLFYGFDTEKQTQYEESLRKRYGNRIEAHIKQSKAHVKDWTMQDWQKSGKEFDAICKDLAIHLEQGNSVDSPQVQTIIKRHYEWLKKFWTPNKESYIGLGIGYTEKEWNERFEPYHPKLAQYLAEGMNFFAENLFNRTINN